VFVPDASTSGDPLSETSTYDDATFASLGITPGTYVYGWGSGADADTLTIVIGVPEPSTWAMMLLGFVALDGAAITRSAFHAII
jgi:PEP-CTERM motif